MKMTRLSNRAMVRLLVVSLLILLVACTSSAGAPGRFEPLQERARYDVYSLVRAAAEVAPIPGSTE